MAYYIEEKTIKMTADNLIQKKKKMEHRDNAMS